MKHSRETLILEKLKWLLEDHPAELVLRLKFRPSKLGKEKLDTREALTLPA